MEKEYYKISKNELLYFLRRDAELDILKWDGVDNWSGFGVSYTEYLKEFFGTDYDEEVESLDLHDVAQERLKEYTKI